MKDFMGIINLNEREDNIKELTYNRPLASIPFGGRYRIIDFALSNMSNSGLVNVSIFTQNKYHSLLDHLGSGKPWDLDRRRDGLLLYSPMFNYYTLGIYRGDIDNFKTHMDYIHLSKQQNVIITPSYMICNIDYKKAAEHFLKTNADITVVYKKAENCSENYLNYNTLEFDENGRVTKVEKNFGKKECCNISMEMYIIKKHLLLDIVHTCVSSGEYEDLNVAIQKNLGRFFVNAYEYKGYVSKVDSIQSYFKANMDIINQNVSKELFFQNGLIYTKVKDAPPSKYMESAEVKNSVIANGVIIEGSVENSVIFRSVKIHKNAVVHNSIIMQNCVIEEGVYLKNVILDKNVRITANKQLKGDNNYPIVIEKRAVI